jgi:cellulose synthase/poly-beta-1,6-N-acetylglucosamine synthase-like glycosyltransferase
MAFTTDPVCWTWCPDKFELLGRQRRRWQLGLIQTIMKHNSMLFNYRYGALGMLSMPFQTFIEAFGCLVEFGGYILIPLAFILGLTDLNLFLLFILLSMVYGALLSVGGVLLEELTYRRYPKMGDLLRLLLFALMENFGYRQLTVFYRVEGFFQYLGGKKKWETVRHDVQSRKEEAPA